MTGRRALLVAAALAATGWWAGTAGAHAASSAAKVTRVGWWSQQPGAQAQPAGGFQVADGPQGPQSEAAVEVAVDPSAGAVTLVLDEGPSVGDNLAAIDACLVRGSWTTANPGAWTAAPVYDCSSKASLTHDSSSNTWHADVSALVAPGTTTSLMLLPDVQAVGGGVTPAFQLTFTAAVASAPSVPAAGATSSPGSDYVAPADSSAGAAAAMVPPAGAAPSLAAPAELPVAVPAVPAAPTSTPAQPQPTTSSFVATPAVSSGPADHTGGRPWWRLALLVPLSAVAGAGAVEARRRWSPAP